MVSGLQLPLGSRCIKYLMFIFNLLFVITGIILLAIGATIKGIYSGYPQFLGENFLSIPNLLIAVGAIIFFIAFFGCCGAVRENYCLILVFTGLMILVFILELSGGIAGYVLRNKASNLIHESMITSMQTYEAYNASDPTKPLPEITIAWDNLQRTFECCGTNNYTDWNSTKIHAVPATCCGPSYGHVENTTCTNTTKSFYHDGCFGKFTGFIKGHAVQLGGAGLGIAFIQAIGIWFSIYLARAIKANYETV